MMIHVEAGTRRLRLFSVAIVVGLVGCSSGTSPLVCPEIQKPGLVIEIRDARTFAPIAAEAMVTIRDGEYVERIGIAVEGGDSPLSKQGVYSRPGVYTVEVERRGYAPLTITGIVLTSDGCFINLKTVYANLTPLP